MAHSSSHRGPFSQHIAVSRSCPLLQCRPGLDEREIKRIGSHNNETDVERRGGFLPSLYHMTTTPPLSLAVERGQSSHEETNASARGTTRGLHTRERRLFQRIDTVSDQVPFQEQKAAFTRSLPLGISSDYHVGQASHHHHSTVYMAQVRAKRSSGVIGMRSKQKARSIAELPQQGIPEPQRVKLLKSDCPPTIGGSGLSPSKRHGPIPTLPVIRQRTEAVPITRVLGAMTGRYV